MKKIVLTFVIIIITLSLYSQPEQVGTSVTIQIPKHEIGFSVGAFPLVGFISPPGDNSLVNFGNYWFEHWSYERYNDGRYEKMYHLGSYALNYNYHFNSKHSLGISLSWVGRHIDKYSMIDGDTINGSGWKHYFTLQWNYRYTYYRKNKIALYCGFHSGALLCVRDESILYKKIHHRFLQTIGNERYYFNRAMHLNAFGIEIGTKYVFYAELGIGTQGIIKTGFKCKI